MFWIEQRLNSYYEGIMVGFMPQVSLFLLVVRLFVWKRKTILTFHNIMQYPNNIIIGWYPVHDGISQKNGYQSYYNEIFQHSTCIIVISHYIQIYIYISHFNIPWYPIRSFFRCHFLDLSHEFQSSCCRCHRRWAPQPGLWLARLTFDGVPKIAPQIIQNETFVVLKPVGLGYHFRKPPFKCVMYCLTNGFWPLMFSSSTVYSSPPAKG